MPYTYIKNKKELLDTTFIMCIIFTMSFYLSYTFGSVFLSQYFETKIISLIYLISFICTLYFSNKITKRINTYHSYVMSSTILTINTFANIGLWLTRDPVYSAVFFGIFIITNMITLFFMNLYLEEFSDYKKTGNTRSIFLIVFNLGVIISIFAGKLIEANWGINALFLISALINLPVFSLLRKYYKSVREPVFRESNLFSAFLRILKNKDLGIIIFSALCLESFYVIMNIYFPLYILHQIGLSSWAYFAVILPIAILPYLILPHWTGVLAEKKYGEKEMLIIAIIILIVLFILIPVIYTTSFVVWLFILILSRIGSSIMETMNNIYYYKKIHKEDVAAVNVFTNMRTLANIVVMMIFTPILFITNNNIVYVFYIYAVVLLMLLYKMRKLEDTL